MHDSALIISNNGVIRDFRDAVHVAPYARSSALLPSSRTLAPCRTHTQNGHTHKPLAFDFCTGFVLCSSTQPHPSPTLFLVCCEAGDFFSKRGEDAAACRCVCVEVFVMEICVTIVCFRQEGRTRFRPFFSISYKGGALKRLEFSNFALKFGPFFVVVGAPPHCGTANPCF